MAASGNGPGQPIVFVLGDSIALHYGPDLERELAPDFLYARKAGAIENMDQPEGANGGDSSRVLAYLRQRQATNPLLARYLLLNCGLHDVKTDPVSGVIATPPELYQANLLEIARLARLSAEPVWIRTTPVDTQIHNRRQPRFHRQAADVDRYNRIADDVMARMGIPSIDLHGFTRNFVPDGYEDHVHFRQDVRAAQARFIAAAVRAGFPKAPHSPVSP